MLFILVSQPAPAPITPSSGPAIRYVAPYNTFLRTIARVLPTQRLMDWSQLADEHDLADSFSVRVPFHSSLPTEFIFPLKERK